MFRLHLMNLAAEMFVFITNVDFQLRTRDSTSCRVGWQVGWYVGHIFECRAVFVLLLLPNRPRLDCCVSRLVNIVIFEFSFKLKCLLFSLFLFVVQCWLVNPETCFLSYILSFWRSPVYIGFPRLSEVLFLSWMHAKLFS